MLRVSTILSYQYRASTPLRPQSFEIRLNNEPRVRTLIRQVFDDSCFVLFQLVANCLVLYISPRETHKLQLVMVPLLSSKEEELVDRFVHH